MGNGSTPKVATRSSLPVSDIVSSCVVYYEFSSTADPATNEELGTVPEMGLAEAKEAIEAAHKAFSGWSRTTAKVRMLSPHILPDVYCLQYRHDVLIKFFNLMQQHSDDLGRLIVRSTTS